MIRNTRYLAIGSHIDADTRYLNQKLETMAKEGWKLTNVNAFLTFKRCKPEDLKFEIDYLDTNMALTSNEDPTVINYIQLCEESGWDYRGNHGPLFIFSAPKDKEVTPLQTDKELMHQIITSSIIKNNLYFLVSPILFLFNNGLTFDLFKLTSYSSTIMVIVSWILFIGYLTYSLLNIVQIFYLKGFLKANVFQLIPSLSRKTFHMTMALAIFMFIIFSSFLLIEGATFSLARSLLFGLLILGVCAYLSHGIIQNKSFNRLKKIILLSILCLLATCGMTLGMSMMISSTPITTQSNLHLQYPVLNTPPLQLIQSREIYVERRSSFVFSDYLAVSDGHLDFDYYQLRKTPFHDQIIEKIIEDVSTGYQHLKPSQNQPFLYEIYRYDSNELKGYILSDDHHVLVFTAEAEDVNQPEIQEAVITLFKQLANE